MKRRINAYFLCLILPCALLLAILLSLLYHNAAKQQEFTSVRDQAGLVSELLNNGVTGDFHFLDEKAISQETTRLTIVAPDGLVLLDTKADADIMDNHADRPEIIDAFQNGYGEEFRYSETMRTDMYYFAILLNDGNVLRISRAVGGLAGVFAVTLPTSIAVTVLIIIIANFASHRLTKYIIAPIENIDFDSKNITVYEELLPYIRRIELQKQELNEKLDELSKRTDTIEAIAENMKEGLILTDNKGSILTANNSARGIFGDHIEQINVSYICREEEFHNAVKQCLSGENVEIQLQRDDKVYAVSLSTVHSNETDRGAVILFQDATERRRAEKQRHEFSANVSHELKTPLTTISALSEMIENDIAKTEDIKIFAARISEQAGRLLALIDDIIRLSEFDEGRLKIEDTVFDIWELAETVVNSLRDNSRSVEIELTGEKFDISANRRMIDELLYNLIDNGIKYNKEGGLVKVDLGHDDNGLCKITVTDTGIGIPEQYHDRIFERFYRVDKSRSKKTGGTGLGLSIVKHITEYYGGSIELQSAEGSGTTVTCYLAVND